MESTGQLIVETDKYHFPFKEKFIFYKKNSEENQAGVEFKEMQREGIPYLCFSIKAKKIFQENSDQFLKQYMAHMIYHFIITYMSDFLLESLIKRYYSYFNQSEREIILHLTLHKISEQSSRKKISKEKAYIIERLQEYFQENSYINLEGFVHFRLKKYLADLKYCVESTIDEFLMEQEYQEFLKLLKYFVTLQEPKIDQVHITVDHEGNFQVRDSELRLIEQNLQENSGFSFFNTRVQKEDFIISFLVNFAPKKIVVHQVLCYHYPKAVEAILNVFNERVEICKKCKLCKKQRIQL